MSIRFASSNGFSHTFPIRRKSSYEIVRPFPLSATWQIRLRSAHTDKHGTYFWHAKTSFDATNYYGAAVHTDGATEAWALSVDGTDIRGADVVAYVDVWVRQGFVAWKTATSTEFRFYYELPKGTLLEYSADASYYNTPDSTAFIALGDNTWSDNEQCDADFRGLKIWQARLPLAALMRESEAIYPVISEWERSLWECWPLAGMYGQGGTTFTLPGIVHGRHFFSNNNGSIVPTTSGEPPIRIDRLDKNQRYFLPLAAATTAFDGALMAAIARQAPSRVHQQPVVVASGMKPSLLIN